MMIFRYAEGKMDQLPELARGLVGAKVDLVVVAGTRAAVAVGNATRRIPIVMISSDPLGTGLIETLSRPAGNVTGLSLMFQELAGKRLGLLRETFPRIRRLAAFWNALDSARFHAAEKAAQRLGFHVVPFEIRQPADLSAAFGEMASGRAEGLFTFTSALLTANRKTIVLTAAKSRLPGIYHNHAFVEDGGLMSYAPDMRESFRRAAVYVDKILKGARPADLPVEQPMKFELVINLKAANQMAKQIPSAVLARADRIIN